MAQIGEAAGQCLSGSYQSTSSPSHAQPAHQQQGQASPAGSSSQYESQHSPFGDMSAVQGVQEFHAEFITHPINYNQLSGRGSPGRMPGPGSPEQSPSPSSVSPNNTLPSFIDTYTPSVVTIEPRPFGTEADYENRLRHGKQQQQQSHTHGGHQPQPQQMTVKFHLKTEAPDSYGPGQSCIEDSSKILGNVSLILDP